jgi:hypothetical protein
VNEETPIGESQGGERTHRPSRLELSLWLLLAFIGLNCSAFLAAPAAALAEAVETANSSRGADRSAHPAKLPRVAAAAALKKLGGSAGPTPVALALPDALVLRSAIGETFVFPLEAVPLGTTSAPFQARAPPPFA